MIRTVDGAFRTVASRNRFFHRNKKFYDPRMALRAAEEATVERLGKAMEDLKCVNVL